MSIVARMQSLLNEEDEAASGDPKVLIPQLVLAMSAVGMDPGDEGHQQMFVAMLKKLTSSKASLLKAMKSHSSSKASKALKLAKASL